MSFFSLRDARGVIQVLVKRSKCKEGEEDVLSKMSSTPVESVVRLEGTVKARPESARVRSFAPLILISQLTLTLYREMRKVRRRLRWKSTTLSS